MVALTIALARACELSASASPLCATAASVRTCQRRPLAPFRLVASPLSAIHMACTYAELQGEASAALVKAVADMLSTAVFVTYEQVRNVHAAASHHGPANDLISL